MAPNEIVDHVQDATVWRAESAWSQTATDDADVWTRFAGANMGIQFCSSWLTILCRSLPGARAALLLLEADAGEFKVGAAWPDPSRDLAYLAPAAEQALQQRRGLVCEAGPETRALTPPQVGHQVAYPVEVRGHLHGVVVVDLGGGSIPDRRAILRQIHWGVGWLETMFLRRQAEEDRLALERTEFALDVLATADEPRLQGAAIAVVNGLAARLSCRRVSVGLVRRGSIRLVAISHSAVFHTASTIVAAIENAMEEAVDQAASVTVPALTRTERAIALSHDDLARLSGASAVVSVRLTCRGDPVGALTLERDRSAPFDERTLDLLESAAASLGPLLAMKARGHRLVAGRLPDRMGQGFAAVFGPRRPGAKVAALAAVAGVAALGLWQGEFRVSAKALVEAAQQHAIVAPFDGYVASASARAGDIVEAGQVLAQLDDRDAQLDAVRARSAVQQQTLKYDEALGKQDRVAARISQAGLDEAKAQLAIVEDRIARSTLRSSLRGLVVSGDLSQTIGSPVEKGKTLFEVASLDAYRVALQVDERDIAAVEPGETGLLVLAGLTGRSMPFSVRTVTPLATAADGRNTFRVEGDLRDPGDRLRPGMEGIGKIDIDRRPMLDIWSRPVVSWLRMTLWTWWP